MTRPAPRPVLAAPRTARSAPAPVSGHQSGTLPGPLPGRLPALLAWHRAWVERRRLRRLPPARLADIGLDPAARDAVTVAEILARMRAEG